MTILPRSLSQRCSLALLAFALVLAPALSRADTSSLDLRAGSGAPPTSLISNPVLGPEIGRISYGAQIALDLPPSGFSVGPRLTGEVMYGFMDLAPQLRLDLGGRVSWAYHSADTGLSGYSASIWTLDLVPDAKLRYAVNDQLGIYGDVGLGLAWLHSSASGGGLSGSDDSLALAVQFGAGVAYAVTPTINVTGELRLDVYSKSGYGLAVAIPTVGLEFH